MFEDLNPAHFASLLDGISQHELLTTFQVKLKDYPSISASQYASVAALVVFLYDILLTLPDEVKYLWSSSNSPVKTLYFINRYLAIPFLILSNFIYSGVRNDLNDEFCWTSTALVGIVQEICMISGKLIMLLRVMALYSNGKVISFIMILLLVVCSAGSGTSLALTLVDIRSGPKAIQFQTTVKICLMSKRSVPMIGIPSLVFFDLIVVILTAIKAIDHALSGRDMGKRSGILFTLWTDGVGYFFIVAASHTVAILVWTKKICPANMFFLGLYLHWALSAAIIARLVLRLRKASVRSPRPSGQVRDGPQYSTTAALDTGGQMVFGKGSSYYTEGKTLDTGTTVSTFVDWRTQDLQNSIYHAYSDHQEFGHPYLRADGWVGGNTYGGRQYGAGQWR